MEILDDLFIFLSIAIHHFTKLLFLKIFFIVYASNAFENLAKVYQNMLTVQYWPCFDRTFSKIWPFT